MTRKDMGSRYKTIMNRNNYQKELDRIIAGIGEDIPKEERPSLFLHSCCAPCSSYVLEYLHSYFRITVFYYNPNITPEGEYMKRVRELKRFIAEAGYDQDVVFLEGDYDPSVFFTAVKGLEDEPERGERCRVCYRLRMEEAARMAASYGSDYFTTALSISPHKDADRINEIGQELESIYGVRHLPSDFKKKGGYQRSIQLSREYGLYRQDYCGCVFSRQL